MSSQDEHMPGPVDDDPEAAPATAPPGAAEASEPDAPEQDASADAGQVKRVIEALLFSADRPVSASRLAEISGAGDGRQVRRVVKELQQEYDAGGRAFAIEEIAGGFQLLSRPEFAPWVLQLANRRQQETLSKAALETLAIVSYRQPITRAEIEDIRGVQSGHILRSLVDRRMLKVVGKSEELGRPLLYGTTRRFLEAFGLRSLKDLPRRPDFGKAARARQAEAEPKSPDLRQSASGEMAEQDSSREENGEDGGQGQQGQEAPAGQ